MKKWPCRLASRCRIISLSPDRCRIAGRDQAASSGRLPARTPAPGPARQHESRARQRCSPRSARTPDRPACPCARSPTGKGSTAAPSARRSPHQSQRPASARQGAPPSWTRSRTRSAPSSSRKQTTLTSPRAPPGRSSTGWSPSTERRRSPTPPSPTTSPAAGPCGQDPGESGTAPSCLAGIPQPAQQEHPGDDVSGPPRP